MSKPPFFSNSEIIGAKVVGLWQGSNDPEVIDGIQTHDIYVELDNGTLFKVNYLEHDDFRIPRINIDKTQIARADIRSGVDTGASIDGILGLTVSNIVVSYDWPSFGVILSDGRVLHIGLYVNSGDWVGGVIDSMKDYGDLDTPQYLV